MAARLDTDRGTVRRWRTRFLRDRLDGLSDEPRPGVPRTLTDAQVKEVVVRTLEEVPAGATAGRSGSWPRGWVSRPRACCKEPTP
ncbi:helix-turn-helix domain-containing protein [Streptomyces beigongshangae]|uniref:helix-turn-helix domain-containing protein n=1 Tax=Streptomyces beigongshangae TaxID=2841597 RepID=UPI0027DF58EC|nr:helix-turn-helix domain-containing protein [Streptomyces sp. REN17]